MPSTSQAGVGSFFGGLARGISDAATERKQAKQAQKDAELKLQTELVVDGFKNGTIKNQPEAMAYLLKLHGAKDTDGRIRNLMDQASVLIPQKFDQGTMPSTSIGLTDPSRGQSGPAASGPAPSPGRSVALKSPVQTTPGPPQFMSGEEIDARDLKRQQGLSDIEQQRQLALEHAKAEDAQKLAALKTSKGTILTGDEVPEGAVTSTGAAVVHDGQHRYQSYRMGDGSYQYEPIEGKVDNSPLGRETQLNIAAGMDPETARKTAAVTLKKNEQNQFLIKTLQAKTAAAKLDLLQQTMPLTVSLLNSRIKAEDLLNETRDAILSGDAKTQMDLATARAAKIVTNPKSPEFGHSAVEVTDKVLHEMGFDPDDVRSRIKTQSATSQLLQESVGGNSQPNVAPANMTVPEDVTKVLKGVKAGNYQDPKTQLWYHVDDKGTITAGKK